MTSSSLIVRPLASTAEYTLYYRLGNTAFFPEPSEEDAQHWQNTSLQSPDFRAERVRGALREGQLLGGYGLYGRALRLGVARISTGCIGAVVTAPEPPPQGVARALMPDSLAFSLVRNQALLLLEGTPKFY